MRAVHISRYGDPEVLEAVDVEKPDPAEGEVVVEVKACGVSHLDLRARRGEFPMIDLPVVPGCDVAGIETGEGATVVVYPVVSCGRCRLCAEGSEHLCREAKIIGVHRDGGYAEQVAVPRRNVIPVSDAWDHAEWAATPLVFLSAWHALVTRANLRVGETILIHAAGSGLGSAAVQIASAGGSRVIATAAGAAKVEKAKRLGATDAIDYGEADFADAVRELTKGEGVDVVLDHIGGPTLEASVSCLARGGRLVSCGETGHPSASLALQPFFNRERNILGAWLGTRKEFLDVLQLLSRKTVRPVVDATFPLERAGEAQEYLEERHAFGKVVLTV